jgi:hypothetical protein
MKPYILKGGFIAAVTLGLIAWGLPSTLARADSSQGTWTQLQGVANFQPDAMILLTNGSVLFSDQSGPNATDTGKWYLLTPNDQGSYINGAWQTAAQMPSGYAPMNAGTGILPDGKFIIEGGDNNGTAASWTNQGAIYDPVANTWTMIDPPNSGAGEFQLIGDAPSVMLANGTFLFGPSGGCSQCSELSGQVSTSLQQEVATLNESTLSWNVISLNGRVGSNPEAGFTLLPNGDVLTIPTYLPSLGISEIFDPNTGAWTHQQLPQSLLLPVSADLNNDGEIGPMVLLPDGNVFAEGDNGNTAVFDTTTQTWSAGPSMPQISGVTYTAADAPAAVLQNGDVLMDLSPYESTGKQDPPAHFFLFDGTSITQIADPPSSANTINCPSYCGFFLDLPNGQVLFDNRSGPNSIFVYTPSGSAEASWLPSITSAPTSVQQGTAFNITGTQLSGITTGAAYGDDWNSATNFPIAQLTNVSTKNVYDAVTTTIGSYSVAPGTSSTSQFEIPQSVPSGVYQMSVVASGFASSPVTITVGTVAPPTTLPPTTTTVKAPKAKTITCHKGKLTKKVRALKPVCPRGYKKNKAK